MSTEPDVAGIRLSQDPAADALLARSPFALLIGMILDQQTAMEKAFAGPYVISQRLGGDLMPSEIAAYDPEEFQAILAQAPPVHRNPAAMAPRIQQLATFVTETYAGDCKRLWTEVATGAELAERIQGLPGFGRTRARILLALLGKQFGITPIGWREAAEPYGEEGTRLSIADVTGPESLDEVRGAKTERKVAMKFVQQRGQPELAKTAPAADQSTDTDGAGVPTSPTPPTSTEPPEGPSPAGTPEDTGQRPDAPAPVIP